MKWPRSNSQPRSDSALNPIERAIHDAKESFSDRIKDYGSAVTVGVFIGSAITTGTLPVMIVAQHFSAMKRGACTAILPR